MKRQAGFAGLISLLPAMLWALGAVAVVAGIGYGVHRLAEWVRAPQYKEIKLLQDQLTARDAAVDAMKVQAGKMLAEETAKVKAAETERDISISRLEGQSNADKIKRDAYWAGVLASNKRMYDRDAPRCGQGSGSAESGAPGVAGPAQPAGAGNELSRTLTGLLGDVMRDTAATIAQYDFCVAYARVLRAGS